QARPAIAMDPAGDFVVAWEGAYEDGSGYGIYARRFTATGAPAGPEIQVNVTTLGDQRYPSVAMDSAGDFVVAWQGYDADGYGVFARRFNAAGQPQSGEVQVNGVGAGDQSHPRVAAGQAGNYAVVWQSAAQEGNGGVYARRYGAAGAALGGEFRVNTTTAGDQLAPAVSSNAAGELAFTW